MRLTGGPDAVSGMSSIRAQEHAQPGDGAFVIFALSTHIAHPGWEVRNGDQFLPKPGKVSDVPDVHNTGWTVVAWDRVGGLRRI